MNRRAWVSLIFGVSGFVLLILTVLWSTGRIDVPGPLATLRTVPSEDPVFEESHSTAVRGHDRAREFRERILASIWREQLLTITVHVALCDVRLSKVANPAQGRGDSYRDNLYWGALYGVETFFKNQSEWNLVHVGPGGDPHVLRRVVFFRRVNPSDEWRQRGVTKPFDICMMAQAWAGPYAADAMRATVMDALGSRPPRVIQIAGRTLSFGSGSDIVGYLGYNAIKDGHTILPSSMDSRTRTDARGVFFICAWGTEYLDAGLRRLGLYPVLLVTQHVAPEAYILRGITDALVVGQVESGFSIHAAQQYARYAGVNFNEAKRIFVQD